MTDPEVDELRMLRQRAYGPAADIQSDLKALERLRQLEDGRSSESAVAVARDDGSSRIESTSPDDPEQLSSTSKPDSSTTERRRNQFRPRRATVLIVLAVALFAAAAMVALTLVQRVQTDPLQVGASQVARLSADSGFETPAALSPDRTREVSAYRDFYGVRTVIQEPSDTGSDDECMTIYEPELLDVLDDGYSYSGELFLRACAAGAFPAAVVFTVLDDFPEPLRNAYPVGTSLQFVYDRSNNEIVIFHE